jgi:hypothetical protein
MMEVLLQELPHMGKEGRMRKAGLHIRQAIGKWKCKEKRKSVFKRTNPKKMIDNS